MMSRAKVVLFVRKYSPTEKNFFEVEWFNEVKKNQKKRCLVNSWVYLLNFRFCNFLAAKSYAKSRSVNLFRGQRVKITKMDASHF